MRLDSAYLCRSDVLVVVEAAGAAADAGGP